MYKFQYTKRSDANDLSFLRPSQQYCSHVGPSLKEMERERTDNMIGQIKRIDVIVLDCYGTKRFSVSIIGIIIFLGSM